MNLLIEIAHCSYNQWKSHHWEIEHRITLAVICSIVCKTIYNSTEIWKQFLALAAMIRSNALLNEISHTFKSLSGSKAKYGCPNRIKKLLFKSRWKAGMNLFLAFLPNESNFSSIYWTMLQMRLLQMKRNKDYALYGKRFFL